MATAVEALMSGGNLEIVELHRIALSDLPKIVTLSVGSLARKIDADGFDRSRSAGGSFTTQVTIPREDPRFLTILDRIPQRVKMAFRGEALEEIVFLNLSLVIGVQDLGSEARVTFHDKDKQEKLCWGIADLLVLDSSNARVVEETIGEARRAGPNTESIQAFFGFASRLVNQNSTKEASVVKAG